MEGHMAEGGQLSFESAFRQLEETVALLESGDLTIDEMLAKFEEGMSLVVQCRRRLDTAQARVTILSREVEDLTDLAGSDDTDLDH
jgi:exodeoxyribonuclease VII small subunit